MLSCILHHRAMVNSASGDVGSMLQGVLNFVYPRNKVCACVRNTSKITGLIRCLKSISCSSATVKPARDTWCLINRTHYLILIWLRQGVPGSGLCILRRHPHTTSSPLTPLTSPLPITSSTSTGTTTTCMHQKVRQRKIY